MPLCLACGLPYCAKPEEHIQGSGPKRSLFKELMAGVREMKKQRLSERKRKASSRSGKAARVKAPVGSSPTLSATERAKQIKYARAMRRVVYRSVMREMIHEEVRAEADRVIMAVIAAEHGLAQRVEDAKLPYQQKHPVPPSEATLACGCAGGQPGAKLTCCSGYWGEDSKLVHSTGCPIAPPYSPKT